MIFIENNTQNYLLKEGRIDGPLIKILLMLFKVGNEIWIISTNPFKTFKSKCKKTDLTIQNQLETSLIKLWMMKSL